MFVCGVSAVNFKAGKIELDSIHRLDLPNYDSLKLLARQKFCDILIEKRSNVSTPDYQVYNILARRKWINPEYVYTQDATTVHKSASLEEVAKKVYQASSRAVNVTAAKTLELARSFIR
jgi:hypothetical protein